MAVNEDPFGLFLPSLSSPEPMDQALAGTVEENDTDFFNSAYNTAFNSPGQMYIDDTLLDSSNQPLADISRPTTMNPADAHSVESSPPDSSSDSSARHKRTVSSNSSQSGLLAGDVPMIDDGPSTVWKRAVAMVEQQAGDRVKGESSSPNTDIDMSNRAMEHHFDFESAASSPSPPPDAKALNSSGIKGLKMPFRSPRPGPLSNLSHHHGMPDGSFETYPSTVMMKNQNAWASSSFPTAPGSTNMAGQYPSSFSFRGLPQTTPSPFAGTSNHYDGSGSVSPAMTHYATAGVPFHPQAAISGPPYTVATPPKLYVHPVRDKSRVETQIPIKLTLYPIPLGITKLHLQTHTISKPKLIAKPTPTKSPEMLEMYTMLVCTSAMQDPAKVQRALARAAASATSMKEDGRRSSSGSGGSPSPDDDENKPLNGGPINICAGCITRERKRAGRKKSKNKEEEEMWQEDEAKRIIVFNTHEVKDWQAPSRHKSGSQNMDANTSGSEHSTPPPVFPEDAMQVDLPMRIACYCRHQEEKLGFQVIFTLKDHQDNVVAQTMTNSIVVTDDHKNPADKAKDATCALPSKLSKTAESAQFPGAGVFSKERFGLTQFTHAHSMTDLQGLQHNFNPPFTQPTPHFNQQRVTSQPGSTCPSPYNLSRPPSPSLHLASSSKRRKISGVGKLPDGLTMTRLPDSHVSNVPTSGAAPTSLPSATQSPFAPTNSTGSSSMDHSFHYSTHRRFPRSMNGSSVVSSPFQPNLNPATPAFNNANFVSSPSDLNSSTPNNNHVNFYPSASSTNPPTPINNDYNFFANAQRSQSMDDLSALQGTQSAPGIAQQAQIPNTTAIQPNPNFDMTRFQGQAPVLTTADTQNTHASLRSHAQALATSLNGLPGAIAPPYQPTILEVFPASGPKSGGIKIIILGSGFREGLEVIFGAALAPTTTHWGEKCLVCTLPPSTEEMTVTVRLLDRLQQAQLNHQQPVHFRYVDDNKQQLMELALAFLNHKYTGKDEHAEDVARNILSNLASSNTGAGQAGATLPQGIASHAELLQSTDLEASLMSCLDLVDIADSPFATQLNTQRPNGQSMLHYSASLGYLRLLSGLLARGADPDLRDNGGFTPMHMAALNGHLRIVRKLRSSGGDPTLRSLRGATPADMATSPEVREVASNPDHHVRSRSAGATMVSRQNPMSEEQMQYNMSRQSPMSEVQTQESSRKLRSADESLGLEDDPDDQTDEEIEDEPVSNYPAGPSSKPPAYDEIYPAATQQDHDLKKASTIRAAGDALLDQKCMETFDDVRIGSSSATTPATAPDKTVSTTAIRAPQNDENVTALIVAPKQVKRLRSDRKLWFVWVPILILVLLAMLTEWIPPLRVLLGKPFQILLGEPFRQLQQRFIT